MPRFVKAFLAEHVTVDDGGIASISDTIRGHFGPRDLPWTTAVALVAILDGTPGEESLLTFDVILNGDPNEFPLVFGSKSITITMSGRTTAVFEIGPLEFREPGTYLFRLRCGDDSITITAGLTRAPGR